MRFLKNPVTWMGVSVLLMATVCHSQVNRCFPDERPEFPSPTFSLGVEDFGLNIFKLLANEVPGSLFVSPYSLWSVLTLAYFGSEGKTRGQLERALNLRSKSGTFTSWNALKLILQDNHPSEAGAKFKSLNRAYFARNIVLKRCLSSILFDLRRLDFSNSKAAVGVINHDVNVTTEGKIQNFIDFLPPSTRFVLINAVYFKGLWMTPFDATQTRLQEFIIPPGESAGVVDMMVTTSLFRHGYASSLQATMLELPYENSNISMFLFLPDTLDTNTVVQSLNRDTFIQGYSSMTRKLVEVGLPKFKMTTRLEDQLITALNSMGVVDLFDRRKANLTGFTRSEGLFADKAIHEATIEVTEEGTEAAAASGILATRFGGTKEIFMCNRPFVYLITDKNSGITLFAGKMDHPGDLQDF